MVSARYRKVGEELGATSVIAQDDSIEYTWKEAKKLYRIVVYPRVCNSFSTPEIKALLKDELDFARLSQ